MLRDKKVDFPLLLIVAILTIGGFFIFLSASLGVTAQDKVKYSSIITKQICFGLIGGTLAAIIISKLQFQIWRKYSIWIFGIALVAMLLVFIPGIGLTSGGATRWLLLGPISFQPSEILKIAYILFLATWITTVGKKGIQTMKFGIIPFLIISSLVAFTTLLQKDTDTFLIMMSAGTAMLWVAGAKWKHILLLALIGLIGLSALVIARPYIRERIMTFINPGEKSLSSSYQIQQSLIAVGSGGFNGRGFGQSLQKFNFLPEPIGDSIFAVAAEEFGFIGGLIIIALFGLFAWRGLRIAGNLPEGFGRLVVVGLVILITVQSFWNIGAMLGVVPLSGLPLLFISHGGTALFFTLCAVGILLSISRHQKSTD